MSYLEKVELIEEASKEYMTGLYNLGMLDFDLNLIAVRKCKGLELNEVMDEIFAN